MVYFAMSEKYVYFLRDLDFLERLPFLFLRVDFLALRLRDLDARLDFLRRPPPYESGSVLESSVWFSGFFVVA